MEQNQRGQIGRGIKKEIKKEDRKRLDGGYWNGWEHKVGQWSQKEEVYLVY